MPISVPKAGRGQARWTAYMTLALTGSTVCCEMVHEVQTGTPPPESTVCPQNLPPFPPPAG